MPHRRSSLHRLGVLAALGALLGVAPTAARATPPLQVFSAGLPANAAPVVATPAAGGGVWFSQSTPGTPLGRVTVDGTIVEQPMPMLAALLTGSPTALATAPAGDVWLVDGTDILRVTPGGTPTDYASSLPPGARPYAIAATPDGSLWFTDEGSPGGIGHIAADGTVSEFRSGLDPGSSLGGITPGPDGDVWFIDCIRRVGRIGRITPAGAITEYGGPSGCPQNIVAGPDGNLWFTETRPFVGAGRITPSGAVTEFATGASPASTAQFIAPGPDGQLYFTEPFGLAGVPFGPPQIGSISLSGQVTQDALGSPFAFGAAWDIVAGEDGNLWLTFPFGAAAIGELAFAPVVTAAASAPTVTVNGATLVGDLQTDGQQTTYYFQYGPTTTYGQQTAASTIPGATGSGAVSADISGLSAGTTYHYRLVATNASGTADGPDETFTTAAPATTTTSTLAAPQPTTGRGGVQGASVTARRAGANKRTVGRDGGLDSVNLTALSLSGVVAGRSAAAGTVSGTVYAHAPGGERFVLGARAVLPTGSHIDARDGIVKLTAVRHPPAAHTARRVSAAAAPTAETIALSDGLFSFTQRVRPTGQVIVTLLGGAFRACPSPRAHTAATSRRPVRRSRVVRQLWSRDSGGNFSTHGRDSVGTVQGTLWLTADRCDGTLTRVVAGRVLVRALHVRHRALLRAGQSYLAPAAP